MFNVPHAIKLNDSLGNEYLLKNNGYPEVIKIKNDKDEIKRFEVNEKYSLWVTMDPSFKREIYDITWLVNNNVLSKEEKMCVQFDESMVGENVYITCKIVQNKTWHKYNTQEEHKILIVICVLHLLKK